MKKIILFFCLAVLPHTVNAKLLVVSTLPVFDGLVAQIGGDLVDHKSLAPLGQDPHFIDAKPSYVSLLAKADALVESGKGLESGWLAALLNQASNPKLREQGRINLSSNITMLDVVPSADRSQGDIHPDGNPHFWYDPRNVLIMAETIANKLAEQDISNAISYKSNLASFSTKLKGKIKNWNEQLKSSRGKSLITYHKSLSYFSAFAGMPILDTIESLPGIPPSSARLLSLVDKIKTDPVVMILGEEWYPAKDGKFLGEKTGIPFALIAEIGQDYIADFSRLVDTVTGPGNSDHSY